MIRILHIVHALTRGGGLSNFLMNYYKNIDRTKIQFDFVYFKESENNFIDDIEQMGGKVYKWKEPSLDFGFVKAANIFFEVHKNDYKAIHCHALFSVAAYGKIAQKYGIKVIAHSHSTFLSSNGFFKKIRNYYFLKKASKLCDCKLACSKAAAIFMFGEKAYKKGEVLIVNNAIQLKRYLFNLSTRIKTRKELGFDDATLVIGHVGGFTKAKNHNFLIDVFSQYHCKNRNSALILLGGDGIASGSTLNCIIERVNQEHLKDSVYFLGVRSDVDNLLMAMDCFVFPSIAEGLGISLVEAQSSGLKCIVSASVPDDAIVSNNTIKLPLRNAEMWSREIEYTNIDNRFVDFSQFQKFDIDFQTTILEQFYLSL